MKKLTCIAIAAFLSLSAIAQLEITKTEITRPLATYKRDGKKAAELYRYVLPGSGDTMYTLDYFDHYDRRKSFAITGTDNMKEFFALIKNLYANKKEKDMDITFPVDAEQEVSLQWVKNEIIVLVKDKYGSYTSFLMSKMMLEKLNVL